MKKIIIFTIFIFIIMQISSEEITYKTTVNNLRLREGPTLKDKIIKNLKLNEEVIFLLKGNKDKINNISGYWIKVKTLNNQIGWCFDAYLKIINNNNKNEFPFSELMFAEKKDKNVSVYKENIKTKSIQIMFEYQEDYIAKLSGNHWEELPPSISINNEKTLLAYTNTKGLSLFNLENNNTKILIKKKSKQPKDYQG